MTLGTDIYMEILTQSGTCFKRIATAAGDGDFFILRMDTILHFYAFDFLTLTIRDAMLPEETAKATQEIGFAIIANKTAQKINANP